MLHDTTKDLKIIFKKKSDTSALEIDTENTICIHTPMCTLIHAEEKLKGIGEGIVTLMAQSIGKP